MYNFAMIHPVPVVRIYYFKCLVSVLFLLSFCEDADGLFSVPTEDTASSHDDFNMVAVDCSDVLREIFAYEEDAEGSHVVYDVNSVYGNDSAQEMYKLLQLTFSVENVTTAEELVFDSVAFVLPFDDGDEIDISFTDGSFGEVISCFRPLSCLILMSYPNTPNGTKEVEINIANIPRTGIEAYIQFRLGNEAVVEDILTIDSSAEDYEADVLNEFLLPNQRATNETDAYHSPATEESQDDDMYADSDYYRTIENETELEIEALEGDELDRGESMHELGVSTLGATSTDTPDENTNLPTPVPRLRAHEDGATDDYSSELSEYNKMFDSEEFSGERKHLQIRSARSTEQNASKRNIASLGQLRRGHKMIRKKSNASERSLHQYRLRAFQLDPQHTGSAVKSISELRIGHKIVRPKSGNKTRKFHRKLHRSLGLTSGNESSSGLPGSVVSLRLGHSRRVHPDSSASDKSAKMQKTLRAIGVDVTTSENRTRIISSLRRGVRRKPITSANQRKMSQRKLSPELQQAFRKIKEMSHGKGRSARHRSLQGGSRSMGLDGSLGSPPASFSSLRRGSRDRKPLTKAVKEKVARNIKAFVNPNPKPKASPEHSTGTPKSHENEAAKRSRSLDPDDVEGDAFTKVNYEELNSRSVEKAVEFRTKHERRFGQDYMLTIHAIYTSCGKNYSCFGYPAGCHAERSCLVTTAYHVDRGRLHVALAAENRNYVALGFSKDAYMGDDVVFICKRAPGSYRVSIWVGYTVGGSKRDTFIEDLEDDMIEISSSVYKGIITCDFTIPLLMKLQMGLALNFNKEKYYLQLAVGLNNMEPKGPGSITYHGFAVSSHEALKTGSSKHTMVGTGSKILIRIHIVLATLTYGFFVPMAIYMARYGQEAFASKSYKDYPRWVIFHVSFQVATVVLNTLCVILAYVGRSGASFTSISSTYHFLVGTLLGLAVIGNAIAGYFVHKKRLGKLAVNSTLKWCHYSIGHLTFAFGAVELIRGAYLRKSSVTCSFAILAGFTLLYYSLAHIILLFNTDYLRRLQKVEAPMLRVFIEPAMHLDIQASRCEYDVRRGAIIFMFYISAVFTVALVVIVLMSSTSCNPRNLDYI